jgi:hypothetical protein
MMNGLNSNLTVPKFINRLTIVAIDDETWKLLAPLNYRSVLLEGVVEVPINFVTDFSSVPRIPFVFDLLGDMAHEPAVVHDWLYYAGIHSRYISDKVMLEAMEAIDIAWRKRWQIYVGVRMGGSFAWNKHRKLGHTSADFPNTSFDDLA